MATGRSWSSQRQRTALTKAVNPSFAAMAQSAAGRGTQVQVRPFALLEAIQAATGQDYGVYDPMPREPQNDAQFGPLDPLTPDPIDALNALGRTDPRAFQYQVGWNLPGSGNREVPWQVLRGAADGVGVIRRCIEVRKKHVRQLRWSFGVAEDAINDAYQANPRAGKLDAEQKLREQLMPEMNRLREFWRKPWKSNDADMGQWINAVMEDYLVLDAVAIFPRKTYGGDVYDLEILDSSTIKPLLDHRGVRPLPPYPAFQQILYGFPRGEWAASVEYDEDGNAVASDTYAAGELFYRRENFRSFSPYGFSPTEMALFDARLYLQRQKWMLAEYDDGSTPMTWVETAESDDGKTMNLTQQRQWERAYNAKVSGQTRERHRIKILPNGWKATQMSTVDERYKPEYDLHLIKLLASFYGVPIAELGFTEPTGLGNNSWHEGQADVSGRLGLRPDTEVLTDVVNALSRQFLNMPPELEFSFVDPAGANDAEADQVMTSQRTRGTITMNEERQALGQSLLPFEEANMHFLTTPTGPIFLEGAKKRADEAAQQAQMATETQALGTAGKLHIEEKRLEDGQQARAEQRDFTREQMAAQAESEVNKAAEISAYRNWRRKHPEDEPRRPFMFKHVSPDDGFAELDGIGPWRVQFEGWEWQIYDDITKSAMSWLEWNAKHPNRPRDARGRWVKVSTLIDALQDEGKRHERAGAVVGTSSSLQGMKGMTQSPAALSASMTPRQREIDTAIREAYAKLRGRTDLPTNNVMIGNPEAGAPFTDLRLAHRESGKVFLADLRDELGEKYNRREIDEVLKELTLGDPNFRMQAVHAQQMLMERDRDSAFSMGDSNYHYMHIEHPQFSRPSQFGALAMADELDARRAGEPGDRMMSYLTDAELQTEIDARIARDPYVARDMEHRAERARKVAIERVNVRQARIDAIRGKADLLAEMEEISFINEGFPHEPDAISRRFEATVRNAGLADDPHVPLLRAAIESGDPEFLHDALVRAERESGLERIGGDRWLGPDQLVTFSRTEHELVAGERLRAGQRALLVRPGYFGTLEDGERVKLSRARVATASADEIRQIQQLAGGDAGGIVGTSSTLRGMDVKIDPKIERRREQLNSTKEPKDNGAKIKALIEGVIDAADLYRKTEAGPSGQRRNTHVGRVRYTPDRRDGEFQIVDQGGDTAGWLSRVTRNGEAMYSVHSVDYEGGIHLEGWTDSIAVASDVLLNGWHVATGRHDSRRISGGKVERYVPKTPEQFDRAQIRDQIMRVYSDLASEPAGLVSLVRIRDRMKHVNKDELTSVLKEMDRERLIQLEPDPNRKALPQEARDAAIVLGGDPKHFMFSRNLTKAGEADPKALTQQSEPPQEVPPPDLRWPGWLLDTAIALAVTDLLLTAMPRLDLGPLLREFLGWSRSYQPGDPIPDVRAWIRELPTAVRPDIEAILTPAIGQAHLEGALVGQRSAETVAAHVLDGNDARHAVSFELDWGNWTPGHPEAARLLLDPSGLEQLLYQSRVTIKSIADNRLDQLAGVLGRGLQAGQTPEQIARDLRGFVDDPVWARRIAVTETNRAMSYASGQEYLRAGLEYKGWMTAFDQRVCKICLHNELNPDGTPRIVPINELFPSGDPWPPAHPHCRCAPIPVVQFPRKIPVR